MPTIKKADLARATRIANCHATYARTEAALKDAVAAHDAATAELLAALGGAPEPTTQAPPTVATPETTATPEPEEAPF